jgi:hypothetical protein
MEQAKAANQAEIDKLKSIVTTLQKLTEQRREINKKVLRALKQAEKDTCFMRRDDEPVATEADRCIDELLREIGSLIVFPETEEPNADQTEL